MSYEMTKEERAAEKAYRAERHHREVESMFSRPGAPQLEDPWEQGLVLVYARGGASDGGRIHRAQCPAIGRTANAIDSKASVFVCTRAWEKTSGHSPAQLGCNLCGTSPETVPEGARYWGETAEQVLARRTYQAVVENQARQARLEQEQAARAERLAHAAAAEELIARHRAEFEELKEHFLSVPPSS